MNSVGEGALLQGFMRAVTPFFNLNRRLPIRCVLTFLLVAFDEGHTPAYYAKQLGMKKNTMSRNLLDIGAKNRTRGVGFGLVSARRNPNNMRELEYHLTNKGRALLSNVLNQVRPAA